MNHSLVELDGGAGEGGGQILRSALALAALTGRPFKLVNIRANRAKPGLQPQHLTCVKAAGAVCGAVYKGAAVGSSTLYFEAGDVKSGDYVFSIGTAGAASLVLHTVYLPLALRGTATSSVRITGGTHNPHAPCHHFNAITWGGYLQRLGIAIEQEMVRPGFYPRGGGEIHSYIRPCSMVAGLKLTERAELTTAGGFSAVALLPEKIARRQADRISSRLKREGLESHIALETWEGSLGAGTVAAVIFRQAPVPTLFFGPGERGKSAESVADDAVDEAIRFRAAKAPVDPHSADQLLLPLAFSNEPSEYRTSEITRHLTTNAATIRKFLDVDISVDGEEGEPGTVRIGL
ncbi:MAG TPA: RNA 3'-terminal phosphate cyclase [Urbifossiella sp.]|nr:RNA 3'-terminal phosphate cyclase [Urbifossiella sp.]